jgi:uncharacterized membrane protein YhaH (DUF805 family)
MRGRIAELLFSAVFMFISIALFIYTFFSDVQMAGGGVEHSAMFFPRIIIGLMVLLSFGMIIEAVVKKQDNKARQNWIVLICAIVLVGLFISFFKTLGFLITTFIFITGYGYALGYRKKLLLIVISSLMSVIIWYIFTAVLEISLPGLPWTS